MGAEESYVYTCCPGWGDHEFCAIKTVVKDGKIVRTEKADYTGAEANEGYICQKGIMSCRQPYNEKRLKWPLKRKGERGGGEWERISWDQAMDEIGEKLMQIAETYGPESICTWNITASVPPSQGLNCLLSSRWLGLFGATDPVEGYGLDNGPFYAAWYDMGDFYKYMTTDPANFDSSDYIIVWGANPIENQERMAKHIVEAKSRGAKIVDIGLLFDGTAGYADQFIPVKPGSDPALSLCMAHLIIKRKQYKEDFLIEHTVAPFLVRDDNGLFVRDAAGNPLVWDKANGKPFATTPGQKAVDCEMELSGSHEVDGVACRTVFDRLCEHVAPYTPEHQETITGVPAKDAIKLTDEYVAAKNAYIIGALGLRYQNQGESYRSFYLLGMLTGNLGRPGAGVTSEMLPAGYPLIFNDAPIAMPNGPEAYKGKWVRQCDFYEQVQSEQPYPIKALIKVAGNPVHNCPNRGRWVDEVIPKLELLVDYDIWMTDTSEYADYVLPDCMPFERYELVASAAYNHIVLSEPAIEPMYEAKDPTYFWTELAKRTGCGEYFDKTAEEWIAIRIDSKWPMIANIDPPLTYERLKEEKLVRAATPPVPWDPFMGMQFGTASGRLEFYAERLVRVDAALASYREPLECPTTASLASGKSDTYPYQFFSGRQRFFMQSMFTDDPVMAKLSGGKPTSRINPVDAAREGIKDGDKVEVYNQRGHVTCEMRLDQAIPPGTIQVWFGWRHDAFEDGMYSELIVPLGGMETIDDRANAWWDDVLAAGGIRAGFATGSIGGMAGAWDTIWDCACALHKIPQD